MKKIIKMFQSSCGKSNRRTWRHQCRVHSPSNFMFDQSDGNNAHQSP